MEEKRAARTMEVRESSHGEGSEREGERKNE